MPSWVRFLEYQQVWRDGRAVKKKIQEEHLPWEDDQVLHKTIVHGGQEISSGHTNLARLRQIV